jgi:Transcriptional regulators
MKAFSPSPQDIAGSAEAADGGARPLGDQAFLRLRQDIIACRHAPGSMLTEAAVMQAYGLGKATCRVALTRLVHEGWLKSVPRHGYRVAVVTLKDVEEVFALRLLLEPCAARNAAGRANVKKLRLLEHACDANRVPRDAGNRLEVFLDANKALHLAIAQAGGNERLTRALTQLLDEMSRLLSLGFVRQDGCGPDCQAHGPLIDAIAAGDGKRAEQLARRHIEAARDSTMDCVVSSLARASAPLPIPLDMAAQK